MASVKTEERHDKARGLDAMHPALALRLLAAGQQAAAKVVDAAIEPISAAARIAAGCLSAGGRLAYAGAGSSGLMAMADALELPGTYGITLDKVVVLLAGGAASLADLAGGYEDDMDLARRDVQQAGIGAGDCLIAVSASGSTPYALAALDEARKSGARVVALANNPGAVLFQDADVAILLQTPPEVVSGSTRMGAGTAQKIALNMFSTLVGIHLGHVHDGHMVNLKADNAKLRARAVRIVADIAEVGDAEAGRYLTMSSGSVKIAILLAAGASDVAAAEAALADAEQNLRRALSRVAAH
ncbi:N-acetylmuramic acid 6-phosphate etherase [Pararhizobium antarcticum]|uniref:N-acetylmuramic acid 6-phosphate etherase n=1 Tax=Pararhizobium antarcticum TaxID=1798805 RepID=A0A657LPY7_9HYPH|nr:N-acetylmuramic acid 6-phosphate etherase [Pararhizobium antarcticum]OJF94965.1 N-acetylmuramic acid 6-phosphate etherase [Pararhizobium antarcticum]OJF97467.1 N-acetylmuramic acid 6-phosphate etherase [Rhizobium sp. 58]